MESYESQLVHDMMAAGDLAAIDRLLRSLFQELKSKISSVRNPHRIAWFHHRIHGLALFRELPSPPGSTGKAGIDPEEVELCAKRLVASGDPGAIETLLHDIADELRLTALQEADRDRQLWIGQAGDILTESKAAGEDTLPHAEFVDNGLHDPDWRDQPQGLRMHGMIRWAAIVLLLLTGAVAAASLTFRFS
jgi:hypothetical protein